MTPPVVLLHGWGGSARSAWIRPGWVDDLRAAGREAVAIDLPGHGAAEAPHDPAAYADLVGLVQPRLPDGPLDVIGFSLGGKLALLLALADPARFRRLVVAGVGENLFSRERSAQLAAALRDGVDGDCPPPVRDMAVYVWQSDNDPRALMACLTRPWAPPTAQALRGLDVPVLLAVGDQDTAVGSVGALADALPRAELIGLPGVDHLATPYSRRLREAALAFLAATDPDTDPPAVSEEALAQ
jgi:pimeloyl-ACP methyl ester carboxylesterase